MSNDVAVEHPLYAELKALLAQEEAAIVAEADSELAVRDLEFAGWCGRGHRAERERALEEWQGRRDALQAIRRKLAENHKARGKFLKASK